MRIRSLLLLLTACTLLLSLSTRFGSTARAAAALPHSHHAMNTLGSSNAVKDDGAGAVTTSRIAVNAMPLAVDGGKTPDMVPDRIAYYHFIMATAIPANALPAHVARRDLLLDPVGFSKDDRDSFITALSGVREQLERIAQHRTAWVTDTPTARAALEALKGEEDQILDNTRLRLQNSFSSDGQNRLDAHVRRHVKRLIKIYGQVRP
jgi:hypothetical protein